jgi:hypothetical protein
MVIPPILDNKHTSSPSVFVPPALLREARRQKNIPAAQVPTVCVLDPDGDLVRSLRSTGRPGLSRAGLPVHATSREPSKNWQHSRSGSSCSYYLLFCGPDRNHVSLPLSL